MQDEDKKIHSSFLKVFSDLRYNAIFESASLKYKSEVIKKQCNPYFSLVQECIEKVCFSFQKMTSYKVKFVDLNRKRKIVCI